MSVINQMLRDLDARQASEQERAGLPPRLRTLPPAEMAKKQSWRMLVVGVGVGALATGIIASLVIPPAPGPAIPPPPVSVAPPAPVTAPTPIVPQEQKPNDMSEMKLSTLLALAKTLPAEPVPAAPAKAKPLAAAEKPLPPPAAKPLPAGTPAVREPQRPAAPPVAAPGPAPILGEAQIDKRSKGGSSRDMAESEYRKGMQAVRRGDSAGAQPSLQHALELDPSLAKARQALLSVLVSGKQWQEAQKVAQGGLALDPAQSGWAVILARLQFEQGDAAAAVETLGRHAVHAGSDAEYQSLFAYLLQKQQRFPEAVEHFRAALSLRPNEGRWWFGLGVALESSGKNGEAKEAYAKAKEASNLPNDMAIIVEQKLK